MMRTSIYLGTLLFSLLLFLSSQVFWDYASAFMRQQCNNWVNGFNPVGLSRPLLMNEDELVLEKYSSMKHLRLKNQGGYQLLYCDGFNLPAGLKVKLTPDGRSCLIYGSPNQAQATTNAYVVTANVKGRSLATVPILVNALVLLE